jgi:peptidoglycan/LPS O-acetylase OafA/YrhL
VIPVPDLPVIAELQNWFGVMAMISVYVVLHTEFNFHNKVEKLLKYYGTISYSTYLYHNIFVAVAVLLLIRLGIHDEMVRLWFVFVFTVTATYLAAGISYRYIERPFIDIGRRLAKSPRLALALKRSDR